MYFIYALNMGIIGGADTPTLIFLLSQYKWAVFAFALAVIAAVVFLIVRRIRKK